MRVTVRKRGDRWQVDYFWNGRRVRRSFKTRKIADGIAAEVMHKVAVGEFCGPADVQERPRIGTFAELVEDWWKDPARESLSPSTRSYYRIKIKVWRTAFGEKWKKDAREENGGKWTGNSWAITDITTEDIRRVVQRAWNRGKSPVTGNRYLTTARTLFRHAVRLGHLREDPTHLLKKKLEPKRGLAIPAETEAAIWENCEPWARDCLTALLAGAFRRGDLFGDRHGKPPLDWKYVHFDSEVCDCPPEEIEGPHVYLPHDRERRTKERAPRYVPLSTGLEALLRRYRQAARLRLKAPPRGPVFVDEQGRPIKGDRVYRSLKAAAKQAGVPWAAKIRTHDLRHTSITRISKSGKAHYRDVMAAVGHREISTHQRYVHDTAAGKRTAMESLTVTPVSQQAQQ